MTTYIIGAICTFGILFNAFLKDNGTSKTDVLSWLILLIGTSLWFIVLPFIIRKKLLVAKGLEQGSIANQAISS